MGLISYYQAKWEWYMMCLIKLEFFKKDRAYLLNNKEKMKITKELILEI